MLDYISKGAFAVAAAATLLVAAPARAETVNVLIEEEAYYPAVIYVKNGDTLVFTNESGVTHSVTGQDGEWFTGPIEHLGEISIAIDQDLHQSFSGMDAFNVEISGNLSYADPPLDDGN